MKASDKPQISKKWWTSEKPADVKGADLEKALQVAEKALVEQNRKEDLASIDAVFPALDGLEKAVDKTIKKECDKKKHKDLITVLDKYYDLIKAEIKRLETTKQKLAKKVQAEEEDEEEVSDNKLFEKDYLYQMIKVMRSSGKELRFGFGLNSSTPEKSALLLKRKGKPELLFKVLKKTGDFSNRLITYGYAAPDQQDGKTLVFRLEEGANEPPQILKLGRRFLRGDKSLRFRKLKLILPGGKTLEDNEPDTDEMEEGGAPVAGVRGGAAPAGERRQDDLSRELATVEKLMTEWQQTLRDVAAQIERLCKAIDDQGEPALGNVGQALRQLVSQFPDLDLSKLVAAAKSNDRAAYTQTLAQTSREIREVYQMLADGPLLSTIDENPLVRTNVHAAVKSVLQRVSSELNVSV